MHEKAVILIQPESSYFCLFANSSGLRYDLGFYTACIHVIHIHIYRPDSEKAVDFGLFFYLIYGAYCWLGARQTGNLIGLRKCIARIQVKTCPYWRSENFGPCANYVSSFVIKTNKNPTRFL